jgi:CheY-like chemotaxis protein
VRVLVVDGRRQSRDATTDAPGALRRARSPRSHPWPTPSRPSDREAPDVIVADIAMPVEDGYDLIRRLRDGSRSAIPMIALTACATAEDESRIRAAGYDAYLAKPIDGSELVAAVQRFARPT